MPTIPFLPHCFWLASIEFFQVGLIGTSIIISSIAQLIVGMTDYGGLPILTLTNFIPNALSSTLSTANISCEGIVQSGISPLALL